MAHGFDAMPIWIKNKRRIIRIMVASWPGLSVVLATGGERRFVECSDGGAIWSAETQMATTRRSNRSAFLSDCELDARRAGRSTIVRALAAAKVQNPYQAERP